MKFTLSEALEGISKIQSTQLPAIKGGDVTADTKPGYCAPEEPPEADPPPSVNSTPKPTQPTEG